MRILFATNNLSKLTEVKSLLQPQMTILSLDEVGFMGDIPETSPTIEGNARQKSLYIYEKCKINCFADDTGLEVEALNGRPGTWSARYAGEAKNSSDNMNKVLKELETEKNRKARFKTVISLVIEGKEIQFEGVIGGIILKEKRGSGGFGYDPIFQPSGYSSSFAEMSMDEKNRISHRAIAIHKLVAFLGGLK